MAPNDILMVVGILAIVLFLVSLGMSYKSWRAHTLILVFLVFCAAATQLVLSAYALRARQSWQELIVGVRKPDKDNRSKGYEVKTEILKTKNEHLKNGERVAGIIKKEGIKQLDQRISGVVLDRGSRWNDCQATPGANGAVELKVPNPEGTQLRKNMLLYAFESKDVKENGQYLGTFRVDKVTVSDAPADADAADTTFTTVSLVPALPLTASEVERIDKSDPTWTVYDTMPIDSHYIFAELEPGDSRAEWLPESTLAEYEKDLQPAEEDDPVDRIEVLVRFREDYTPDTGEEVDPDDENPTGFVSGQLAWLPKETVTVDGRVILGADDLEEQEIVRKLTSIRSDAGAGIKLPGYPAPVATSEIKSISVAPRYVRQLRDYRSLFNAYRLARVRHEEETEMLTTQAARLDVDQQDIDASLQAAKETIARLESDKKQHANEQKVAEAHLKALNAQFKQLRSKRNRLLKENDRLAAELDRLEKQAARAIDRRAPASEPQDAFPRLGAR